MLKYRRMSDVSDFKDLRLQVTVPYEPTVFDDGSPVVVTEWVRGLNIIICRDKAGKITVTHEGVAHAGLVIDEFLSETFFEKLLRWWGFGFKRHSFYWNVARLSGILGYLENWPPIATDVQVCGLLKIPLGKPWIHIFAVYINGIKQSYGSFFPNWVPLEYWGPFNSDLLGMASTPSNVHPTQARLGIMIEPQDNSVSPLVVRVPNQSRRQAMPS